MNSVSLIVFVLYCVSMMNYCLCCCRHLIDDDFLYGFVSLYSFFCQGGILCDEMGLGKTAATLCLHLIHPAKTPSPGVPLDEKEWGSIAGLQVRASRAYVFQVVKNDNM